MSYEFQRSVAIVKPNHSLVSSAYLFEALTAQKKELVNASHGAVQQCLFISDIARFPIGIPRSEDRNKFDAIAIPIFDAVTANEVESAQLSVVRDVLIPKLISGEIDVSDIGI